MRLAFAAFRTRRKRCMHSAGREELHVLRVEFATQQAAGRVIALYLVAGSVFFLSADAIEIQKRGIAHCSLSVVVAAKVMASRAASCSSVKRASCGSRTIVI